METSLISSIHFLDKEEAPSHSQASIKARMFRYVKVKTAFPILGYI